MRIVFMGTPEFAVESLKALVENHYEVVGVITMPDKPAGRGHKLQSSPVKQYALEQGITVMQPEKLKDENFLQDLRALKADLQIVVAFRMLPEVVWNMPPKGTFNLHASLLPQYRGAAPINWAVINGEQETGVTTFFLTHEIDTGSLILQERIPIEPTDNAGTIHDKLMMLGADLVCRTVDLIDKANVEPIEQSTLIDSKAPLRIAPKLYKETCELSFELSATECANKVRGLSPYPTAWAELLFPGQPESLVMKIFEAEAEIADHDLLPGTVLTDGRKWAKVALSDGFLNLKTVQAPARKRMEIGEFLRGLR